MRAAQAIPATELSGAGGSFFGLGLPPGVRPPAGASVSHGVEDVAFHKKRGLRVEEMVKSTWVYRQLRNFRAGIEAGISCLKRAYGLSRCTWKGLVHFKSFVWSSVVAHNLALLARLKPA